MLKSKIIDRKRVQQRRSIQKVSRSNIKTSSPSINPFHLLKSIMKNNDQFDSISGILIAP